MKKIILYIVVIFAVLSACTKHEDMVDTSFQPGNILCSDGSVIHPTLYTGNEKAIGVVFWCNDYSDENITDKGYAVSLEDLSSDLLVDSDDDMSNVSESLLAFDGAGNTAAIMDYAEKDSIAYSAVQKAVLYSPHDVTGWFIASVAQTKAIKEQLGKVYNTFQIVGGEEFSGWYWTSTEDGSGKDNPKRFGIIASIQEGRVTATQKRNLYKIRPIIAIK